MICLQSRKKFMTIPGITEIIFRKTNKFICFGIHIGCGLMILPSLVRSLITFDNIIITYQNTKVQLSLAHYTSMSGYSSQLENSGYDIIYLESLASNSFAYVMSDCIHRRGRIQRIGKPLLNCNDGHCIYTITCKCDKILGYSIFGQFYRFSAGMICLIKRLVSEVGIAMALKVDLKRFFQIDTFHSSEDFEDDFVT